MRISLLCLAMFVPVSACAAQVEPMDPSPKSKTLEETDGLVTKDSGALVLEAIQALKTRVPPVEVDAKHAFFNETLEIAVLESLNAQGVSVDVAPSFLAIASGVVILPDGSAMVLGRGDVVTVGSRIVGGVFENTGDHAVYIGFASGREVTLDPGKVLYVGTYERILRPDQVPGAQRGGQRGGGPEDPSGTPIPVGTASHCWVCSCNCSKPGGGACNITVAATAQTDCSTVNNVLCECEPGDGDGTTSGCVRKLAQCDDN